MTKRSIVKISDETGEAAFNYSFEAMEALNNRLGNDYINRTVQGLCRHEMRIVRLCIRHMLQDTDLSVDDILASVPLNVLVGQLLDSIMLNMKGMTFAEFASRTGANSNG